MWSVRSQAWRNATPFLLLFVGFSHLRQRVRLPITVGRLLRRNCKRFLPFVCNVRRHSSFREQRPFRCAFAISDFNVLTRSFKSACSVSYVSLIFKYRSSEILPSTLSSYRLSMILSSLSIRSSEVLISFEYSFSSFYVLVAAFFRNVCKNISLCCCAK